jgi:hypothetical protein
MNKLIELKNWIQAKRAANYKYLGYETYNVQVSDLERMNEIAVKYGFPFEWLANLINFETGGTWNPKITNNLGYVGLIQFGQAAAQGIGTTREALKNMTFSEQLVFVDKYLEKVFKSRKVLDANNKVFNNFNQEDLFMSVFYPVAVGNPNYQFPDSVVTANAGIATPKDYTNRALRSALPLFTPPTTPSNISEYVQKYGGLSLSFVNADYKWWLLPVGLLIFGSATALTVYFLSKKK